MPSKKYNQKQKQRESSDKCTEEERCVLEQLLSLTAPVKYQPLGSVRRVRISGAVAEKQLG